MLEWMNKNYGRILDIFRRFDSDNSGTISYQEFAAGMKDLGAPATQVEIYLMAMSLDVDGDQQLDYNEFKKLRPGQRRPIEPVKKIESVEEDDEPTAKLKPCPHCKVGLWEPIVENVSGYIMLDLRSSSFQNLTTMPGSISSKVPSNISIYGISMIVKRELGPCAFNVRIYHQKEEGTPEEMEPSWKLAEIGFVGTMPPEEPQPLMLLYDYDYPFLDCPILMANFCT
ncbi:uncharacterized protein [Acropora muricata]